MRLDQLLKLAISFEKQSQAVVSAQPGDVQTALERAKLWNMSPAVSPLLDAAGVPDDAKVAVSIIVSPGSKVSHVVNMEPKNPNVSSKLAKLIAQKFSQPMSNAISAAKLTVDNPLTVNWLNF